MDLDDPTVDLGLQLNLDDASELDLDKSTFGSSDSDYSSAGNDVDNKHVLFSDTSLYDETNSNESFCVDKVLEDLLHDPICEANIDAVSKALPSPNMNAVSPDVPAISSKVKDEHEVVAVDSLNQHDYALPHNTTTKEATVNPNPKIDFKKVLLSNKCLSQITNEKSMSTVSFKVLMPPSHTNLKKTSMPLTNSQNLESSHMTKNAIAARENRLKKKQYIQSLESSVKELKSENKDLKSRLQETTNAVSEMTAELEYMRSVLANVDEVASLIKGIKSLPKFQPQNSRKRRCVEEKTISKFPRNAKSCSLPLKALSGSSTAAGDETTQPGICVHVRGTTVSLELCHHCSQKAAASFS